MTKQARWYQRHKAEIAAKSHDVAWYERKRIAYQRYWHKLKRDPIRWAKRMLNQRINWSKRHG